MTVAPPPNPDAPKPKRHRTPGGKTQRWNPDEEEKLRLLVNEYGASGHWPLISEKLETGRTTAGVEQHWQILTGRRKRNSSGSKGENGVHSVASVIVEATADVHALPNAPPHRLRPSRPRPFRRRPLRAPLERLTLR